ncbi:hypothetical protein IMZ08_20780 [Bacillus luteolus]|uniref:Nucleotidyltransferase-like n=1 Tax=Litchfieldia luteola TaxID=682179 RepID=A0ABR9QPN9_9BACI|nr:nucleotidyltransferase-like protein [Cytobacillus luteolus]MBE4910475.1 hypothetical protein [Cytobacillus luteolus]MBP1943649.1 hypothetical protein [Cytobacillus luteolus]
MKDLLRPIYQERASQTNTLGIIMVEKAKSLLAITDSFDSVILVIVKEQEKQMTIRHYEYENQKASLYTVRDDQLKNWLLYGTNRKVSEWVLHGKVLFDRNEYIQHLKEEYHEFPMSDRQKKMGIEFAKLIRRYQDGKGFLAQKNYLDAYNNVVHALHHLARLSVIEKGFHPEVTVWNQVKQMEPQIHKLYQELIESEEPINKRLELLFLASEFLIHSRAAIGGKHLINVLNAKTETWSYSEMEEHPELESYSVDLEVLLEYLIEKRLVSVERIETKGVGIYHRRYTALS